VHLFATRLARMTAGNLFRPNQLFASSPAMIASAITPQPINAKRQLLRGFVSAIKLRIAHPLIVELLYRSMTIDEQLSYLGKGTSEIIREAELRAKLEKSARPASRCA
jgi:uncharacterized membrane protein AbrB (regulator of aidB expression)